MKNKKRVTLMCIIILIIILVTTLIIKLNKNETFFKQTFTIQGINKEYEIKIPKYSYYYEASGSIVYRFKSLKTKENLEKEIEEILQQYEKKTDKNGNIYYYDKNQDTIIFGYCVDETGIFRDILIRIEN